MTARSSSGPVVRLAHRATSRGARALARRRPWPGVSLSGVDRPPAAGVERLTVPAPSRPGASVLVVTPKEGDAAQMPVVYLLHGWPDAPESPLAAGMGRAAVGAGSFGAALWPPFVLVIPDGTGWRRGDHGWADAADGGDLLESWLVDAVVPAVEGGAPRRPSRRTLAGFSMGGYGALNVGLHHPEVFGSLVSFSGFFRADDPEGVFAGVPALLEANSPVVRATDPTLDRAAGLRVALVESEREPALVVGQAAVMARVLRSVGLDVLERRGPGSHAWCSGAARWPAVLTWLSAGWTT